MLWPLIGARTPFGMPDGIAGPLVVASRLQADEGQQICRPTKNLCKPFKMKDLSGIVRKENVIQITILSG
jgi:hypothetical protein